MKFSEEHPDEAVRIHLKRKAMRQAALRKEYEEKKGCIALVRKEM